VLLHTAMLRCIGDFWLPVYTQKKKQEQKERKRGKVDELESEEGGALPSSAPHQELQHAHQPQDKAAGVVPLDLATAHTGDSTDATPAHLADEEDTPQRPKDEGKLPEHAAVPAASPVLATALPSACLPATFEYSQALTSQAPASQAPASPAPSTSPPAAAFSEDAKV